MINHDKPPLCMQGLSIMGTNEILQGIHFTTLFDSGLEVISRGKTTLQTLFLEKTKLIGSNTMHTIIQVSLRACQ